MPGFLFLGKAGRWPPRGAASWRHGRPPRTYRASSGRSYCGRWPRMGPRQRLVSSASWRTSSRGCRSCTRCGPGPPTTRQARRGWGRARAGTAQDGVEHQSHGAGIALPFVARSAAVLTSAGRRRRQLPGRRLLNPHPDRDRRDRTNHAAATNAFEANGPSGAVLLSRSGKSACHVPAAA